MTYRVEPASPEHIPHLADNMRGSDRREVMAAYGHGPEEALRGSFERSEIAWTLMIENAEVSAQARKDVFSRRGMDSLVPPPEGKSGLTPPELKIPHFLPAAMAGVAPAGILSFTGRPWMLATPALDSAPRTLLARLSQRHVAIMLRLFPRLENWVHADNRRSLRWLKWCGFVIDEPRACGVAGELFHRFYKEAFHV